jgi:hypothetical protein
VLAELSAAYAVIGDVQFLPGYSLALTKTPGVGPRDCARPRPRPDEGGVGR